MLQKRELISVTGLIIVAFLFSIAIRFIWVYQFQNYEAFKYAGEFMINTNDGYFWAEGARDLLSGEVQKNDLSPINQAASQLTYVFAKILPFSFETIIFYMPAFLGSLLVIPIILIANNLKMPAVGFVAALLGAIAVSYYNRTMVGYYDTDMLNIVFPTFLCWSLILALRSEEKKYLLITALEIIAYRWWYPQSYSLEFTFFGLILLYTLVFKRKENFYYELLAMMLFAMMGLPATIRLVIVGVMYVLFKQEKFQKYALYCLFIALALFFVTGGASLIWAQLNVYLFQGSVSATQDTLSLHFFSVLQTVREAGQIPFDVFATRISGHTITFVLSLIGYVLLIIRYPVMALGLPLMVLGFIAPWGGLRFTVYAVPMSALGIAYLLLVAGAFVQKLFINEDVGKVVKSLMMVGGVLAILYPNIMHIIGYKVPTVLNKTEVEQLAKLRTIAGREDYVVTWWDYGYPVRYYSDVKTLIDGGKHDGGVNFPVSYALTSPQQQAAKMARFEVEYTEKAFLKAEKNETVMNNTAQMTLDAGLKDANDFLLSLQNPISLPAKTRDIYYYLPYRMMGIFPTVAQFSNLDIMTGNTIRQPFFYQAESIRDEGNLLHLGSGIALDKSKGVIKLGKQQEVLVKHFIKTGYTKELKLIKEENILHPNGQFNIIYLQAFNSFLIVDDAMFNSTYVQMFVLENYDKNLFEPVILDPQTKIFKLKI